MIQKFYCDFFDETDFVSGYANRYGQNYSLIDLADNGECNKPNPIFVACFSPIRYG